MLVFKTGEADDGVRVKLDLISVFMVTLTELLMVCPFTTITICIEEPLLTVSSKAEVKQTSVEVEDT